MDSVQSYIAMRKTPSSRRVNTNTVTVKKRKGQFRRLWIQRISAAARAQGITYSRFTEGLKAAGIEVDRKILADLAVNDITAFNHIADQAKDALKKKHA